jgi:LPS-assembly lipoprotein
MWLWDRIALMQRDKGATFSGLMSLTLTFLIVFALTSCGFHLRGAYRLPTQMAVVFLKAEDNNGEVVRILKRTLKASNINIVETKEESQAVLSLSQRKQSKRVISVDTQGRVLEYELNYQINFSVKAIDSDFEINEQTIKLQRDFLFDAEDVLGKGREEATLIKDMQQDIVRLIMLRLQAAQKNNLKNES